MSLGPLDSNQMSKMINTAQMKIGEVQKREDVKQQEKLEQLNQEEQDQVFISAPADEAAPEEHMEAAAQAGVLSDLKKGEKEDKSEKLAKGFAEKAEKTEDDKVVKENTKTAKAEEKDIVKIKDDVPPEKFEAAKKIVEGQIDIKTGEPAKSLTEMKSVSEVKTINPEPAKFHPIMDIHDKSNKTMLIDLESK